MARAHLRNGSDGPDRFESERVDFFERVRQCYLERAAREPARFRVVDAGGTVDEVAAGVRAALQVLLAGTRAP
jgi:dTMP kinase